MLPFNRIYFEQNGFANYEIKGDSWNPNWIRSIYDSPPVVLALKQTARLRLYISTVNFISSCILPSGLLSCSFLKHPILFYQNIDVFRICPYVPFSLLTSPHLTWSPKHKQYRIRYSFFLTLGKLSFCSKIPNIRLRFNDHRSSVSNDKCTVLHILYFTTNLPSSGCKHPEDGICARHIFIICSILWHT